MSDYFNGPERLEVSEKTGAPMRMGSVEALMISDYQTLRNFVLEKKWEQAISYFNSFHAQNIGMNNAYFNWCQLMPGYYAELTSAEIEKNIRGKALSDYYKVLDAMKKAYSDNDDNALIEKMKKYFSGEAFLPEKFDAILADMNHDFKMLSDAFAEQDEEKSLKFITRYNRNAVIRHDSFSSFTYSYPTSTISVTGEKMAVELTNQSIFKNPLWKGMWDLTNALNAVDFAALLGEHLRFHFSGANREGSTQIIEDEKKVRLVFDPCGSGGSLRLRLGDEIVNLKEKHQFAWNKCDEVNLYCSHCALNEKYSIDTFGYPKIVVDFQADPQKPCGWTMYKNKEDVPQEVYERLGLKKV